MLRIKQSASPLITAALVTGALACAGTPEPGPEAPAAAESPSVPAASTEPAFEPAYPAEVSTEGLSEADVAQQHSHDGAEAHSHGDDEGHGDSEGDHGHPH